MGRELLGIDLATAAWSPKPVRLSTGATNSWLTVPGTDAGRLLLGVVRLVADLPVASSPEVVWTAGGSELLVHTGRTTLTCNVGVVQVGILVSCDQLDGPVTVTVPFSTGTDKQPRGLFMATFERPDGPAVVIDAWAEALNAFAWECLLTLATQLAASAGKDRQGRPLVPAAIGSGRGTFQVLPMVRT